MNEVHVAPTREQRAEFGPVHVDHLRKQLDTEPNSERRSWVAELATALARSGLDKLDNARDGWAFSSAGEPWIEPSAADRARFGGLTTTELRTMGLRRRDELQTRLQWMRQLADALDRAGFANLGDTPEGWGFRP